MWNLSNFWGEGNSTPTSSYLAVMQEIHVLVVDHDTDGLINTSKLLEMCHYRVTVFELASAAMTMLSNGKVKVDLIMANVNSPDLHGFKLLQLAVNMDIPVILMSLDDNTFMAMRAIESGAFLYIKKPAPVEMLRCLWQHVAREKMRVMIERERLMAANYSVRGIEFREVLHHSGDIPNPNPNPNPNNMLALDKGYKKSNCKGRRGEDEYDSDVMSQSKVKRKVCTEWTQELHEKFMEAVEQLGEGRCFPKEILELMNVPGLTRMQIASHLQKCRNDNWKSPEERRAMNIAFSQSSDSDGSQNKPRRFGSMPRLGRAPTYHLHVHQTNRGGEGSKPGSESETANDCGGENMANEAPTYNQGQQYEAVVALQPNNAAPSMNSPNPSHQSADGYFCFQEMDCLIQNYSGVPQESAGMGQPHSTTGNYHFDQVYGRDQNSKGHGRQWNNAETSNFEGDDSETRGQ